MVVNASAGPKNENRVSGGTEMDRYPCGRRLEISIDAVTHANVRKRLAALGSSFMISICSVVVSFTLSSAAALFGLSSAHAETTCTHYASPNGGGDGLSQSSPFQIADFWPVAGPGKTLCLSDGTYTGPNSMINPPSGVNGNSSAPITIQALNDGAVTIDGQFSYVPLLLNDNAWWSFQGFDIGNSVGSVGMLYLSNNNALRRICASMANPNGNNEHVWLIWASSNNILEDVCGFGIGRNTFQEVGESTSQNTFRRVWLRWEGWHENSGGECGGPVVQIGYGTAQTSRLENIITVHSAERMTAADNRTGTVDCYNMSPPTGVERGGTKQGSLGWRDDPPSNATQYIKGWIAYGYDSPLQPLNYAWFPINLNSFAGPAVVVDVFVDARSQPVPPLLLGCRDGGNCINKTADRITSIRSTAEASDWPVFFSTRSILQSWTITNQEECTTLDACPDFYTGTNPTGARNCFRYRGGTLTTTPLWPWPMDERIKNALARAGSRPLAGGTVTSEIESRYGAVPSQCRQE
jgi:hypothetical protein